ncbi:MAG: PPOX class F420-dependent oxidoreductase [Haloechinothrix sp.]
MDLDQARNVLSTQHRAVLATLRADGTPQMSPILVALDAGGAAIISTRQQAFKLRNIRRDPRVWLCVLPDEFFGNWIQVAGTAEVIELPDAMDGLVDYYRTISGEHSDWNEYRAAMRSERRVLVRVALTGAGPDRSG